MMWFALLQAQFRYHTELDCHGYEHHEPDCELSAMRKEYLLGANGRE
jgi:hypothetical protein